MADVARELSVSPATVSYVLNGREGTLVSDRTRERVLEMAQQMGYRPNRAAQVLAGKRSNVVELCVNGFHPAFNGQVIRAFQNQFVANPYQLRIVNPDYAREEDWPFVGNDWPMDGLIISDAYFPESIVPSLVQPDAPIVSKLGVPIVSTGIYAITNIDFVRVDLSPAIEAALRHLAAHGNRIAYVSLWPAHTESENSDQRYPVYQRVLREFGLKEEMIVTYASPAMSLRECTRVAVRDYIAQHGCPDGIFCFNDERAIATLAALRDLGLKVPQDVRLIGCDGIEETTYHYPPISTIQYPFDEVALLAWDFLSRRIEQPDLPLQSATLHAELVLRESSG
ncbi:catabolite control protein A [Abditibacteriota bacterium]|nr:catabolite control protein A [Abditibacteriota bacterium]